MLVLITARAQYAVRDANACITAVFDNLRDAVAFVRHANCEPIFTWDCE